MNTTRISLHKGVAVTRDIAAEDEKKELEAARYEVFCLIIT